MVDNHWVCKIGDFGLSRIKDETKTMTKCGSPLWVAPEVLQGERFSEACDIYSFAIIVWEVIAWNEPFPTLSSKQVMRQGALQHLRPTIPIDCPGALAALVSMCWKREPSERPTFTNILELLEAIGDQVDDD
jgi:serine/threonine protein kinase